MLSKAAFTDLVLKKTFLIVNVENCYEYVETSIFLE